MSAALTPEQIPGTKQGNEQWTEVVIDRLLAGDSIPDVADEYDSTPSHVRNLAAAYNHALALIDSAVAAERERVLKAIVGDLENAATDCDGHTPYSILMALAEEIRAEHSANPQGETDQ